MQVIDNNGFILNSVVTVRYSSEMLGDPEIIRLEKHVEPGLEGKYILTFGRGECKTTLTQQEANTLIGIGVKLR